MDTSLEEIYQKHPRLRPEEGDSDELRNLKSHYVWLHSMTPEEREEFDREEARHERKRAVESLIEMYHINQDIRKYALAHAKKMGARARFAIETKDHEEAEKYIEYIRTAKETMALIDQEQIKLREEIKDIRRNGTWHERLQAKYRTKRLKKN